MPVIIHHKGDPSSNIDPMNMELAGIVDINKALKNHGTNEVMNYLKNGAPGAIVSEQIYKPHVIIAMSQYVDEENKSNGAPFGVFIATKEANPESARNLLPRRFLEEYRSSFPVVEFHKHWENWGEVKAQVLGITNSASAVGVQEEGKSTDTVRPALGELDNRIGQMKERLNAQHSIMADLASQLPSIRGRSDENSDAIERSYYAALTEARTIKSELHVAELQNSFNKKCSEHFYINNPESSISSNSSNFAELSINVTTAAFADIGVTTEINNILRNVGASISPESNNRWEGRAIDINDINGNSVGVFQIVENYDPLDRVKEGMVKITFDLSQPQFSGNRDKAIANALFAIEETGMMVHAITHRESQFHMLDGAVLIVANYKAEIEPEPNTFGASL